MNKLLKFKDFSFLLESIRVDNDTDKALTLLKKLFQFAGFVGDFLSPTECVEKYPNIFA